MKLTLPNDATRRTGWLPTRSMGRARTVQVSVRRVSPSANGIVAGWSEMTVPRRHRERHCLVAL